VTTINVDLFGNVYFEAGWFHGEPLKVLDVQVLVLSGDDYTHTSLIGVMVFNFGFALKIRK